MIRVKTQNEMELKLTDLLGKPIAIRAWSDDLYAVYDATHGLSWLQQYSVRKTKTLFIFDKTGDN